MTTINTKMSELFQGMAPEMVFKLGEMTSTYIARKKAREAAKGSTQKLEVARRYYLEWGHYDDCGPSYTMEYEEAKARAEAVIPAKISAEKHHKKVCHEFIEMGGTKEQLVAMTKILVEMHERKK